MNNNSYRAIAGNGRMNQVLAICALTAAFGQGAAVAGAQPQNAGQEPITIELSMKRVVTDAKGKETLQDAPRIKPSDVVEYTAVYRNRSKQDIDGLTASLPVPPGLEYVKQTARPASALATADDVQYAAEPLLRSVKDPTGKAQTVEIPYAEYRGLRWDVGNLDAGKKISVSARMRVIALPKSPEELVSQPAAPVVIK